jgi:gas vesicle protein
MLGSNGEMRSKVARYAGTASAMAPVVRRLARDDQLRDDLRVVLEAARKLYDDLSSEEPLKVTRKIFTDSDVRKQIDTALAAIEDASGHLRDARKPSRAWLGWLIAGGIIGGIVALFFTPKTGPTMRGWASNVTGKVGGGGSTGSDFSAPMTA